MLANSDMAECEILLTDNGAPPAVKDHFDSLAKAHQNITVLHNAKNEGFIEPNRRAFRMARGKYLILLNDDTIVPAGWLEALSIPFEGDELCALVGPSGSCCQLRNDFHGESGPRFEYLEGSCLMIDIPKLRILPPEEQWVPREATTLTRVRDGMWL